MGGYLKPAAAELVGTFAFFFIGAGSIVAATYSHTTGGEALLIIALAHGLILAIMVSVFGATSGGHLNPAVTLGFLATRRIKPDTALVYIVAQLIGGTFSGLALRVVFAQSVWQQTHLGSPALAPGVGAGTAVFLEAVLTAFLLLAVFGTAVDPRGPKLGGFAIGLTVGVDVFVGGPLTGAAMNPARAFGPELASGFWDNWWVYWVGPIIGGVIAALFYEYVILSAGAGTGATAADEVGARPSPAR